MNIKIILSKPIPIVWFRLVQLIRLNFYYKTNFWSKIEIKISHKVSKSEKSWKQKSLLFCDKFSGNNDSFPEELQRHIKDSSEAILQGNISIFDMPYSLEQPFNWNTDWRTNHQWKNNYFKTYSFYEKEKLVEYDVKFPWELSRLSFLIPVARRYVLENQSEYIDYVHDVLKDWKQKNPIAHSVNWYPMEVSVRSINLVQLRELLLLKGGENKTLDLINEILILHGIFLWRNIEYTDVRGNHYTANLTALLLLGNIFKRFYKEAKQWQNYALAKIESEFHLQFIDDGVNFEKSISYHRLVVEFYLISFIALQRLGIEIQPKTKEVFKKACLFTKDYTKPNYSTPIIGDNDSASVFQNDHLPLNDHTNLLQLASLFFCDPDLNSTTKIYNSTLEIFGLEKAKALKCNKDYDTQLLSYPKGGFIVIKDQNNYFITDIGEVGMKGRGGHGHNDLFGFELMFDGYDLIVDAGCYTYTGDLQLKNEMKSSEYHNILTIDGQEIAPLIGNWGIADIAKPNEVVIVDKQDKVTISGKHEGYKRLTDAVVHQRKFVLKKVNFKLSCLDSISCKTKHKVQRHLHFSEKVELQVCENKVIAKLGNLQHEISYDKNSRPKIQEYYLSYNYGYKTTSKKLIFETLINGPCELYFNIEKQTKE